MSSVVELYEFRAGEDEVWRYTTRGHDLLANGHVWHSTPMARDDHQITTEVARDGMRLQFPLDHPFASQWLGYGPEQTVILRSEERRVGKEGRSRRGGEPGREQR